MMQESPSNLFGNSFRKQGRLKGYFRKAKTFQKSFPKGEAAEDGKGQCLQAFQLFGNSFRKPFREPAPGLTLGTFQIYLPPYREGISERCKSPRGPGTEKKRITSHWGTP